MFRLSQKYGLQLAVFLPALLLCTRWKMEAEIVTADGSRRFFPLDESSGLVSHYRDSTMYDSLLERTFAERFAEVDSGWQIEREVGGRIKAAKGWRVFKATETDAKGNTLYIHMMRPAVTGFDYRPSLLLDELIKELAPDLLTKYQDAFAMPPSKLNLTEFANMSTAPLPAAKKPGGQ